MDTQKTGTPTENARSDSPSETRIMFKTNVMSVTKSPSKSASDLPTIETNNRQLRDKRDDLIAALELANDPPTLFHSDSGLAYIGEDKDKSPILKVATREVIQNAMTDAATWISTAYVPKKSGGFTEVVKNVSPPRDLAENYMALRNWPGIPAIDGIVTAPIVAPDGSLCVKSGYYPSARIFLAMPPGFKMADTTPTEERVKNAKKMIFETLLGEVSFADDPSRAHALALMLLPFVRELIDGPTPLHLFDAPTQSSGKSFAAKICISPFATPHASSTKADDEEWRKAILAALMSGRSHIFFDNVKGDLSSPMLASCLTEPSMTERAMGGLKEVSVKIRCAWVATANNARLDADTASRAIVLRLDTGMENPERKTYALNPLEYIAENRAVVVSALFILIRNWQAQDSPHYAGNEQSRFHNWQRIIGGILEANQIPGFLENIQAQRDTLDPEKVAWGEFCKEWREQHGKAWVNAAQLRDLAAENSLIAGEMMEKYPDPTGKKETIKLGRMLARRRDKVFSELKICAGPPNSRGITYRVLTKDDPENAPQQMGLEL